MNGSGCIPSRVFIIFFFENNAANDPVTLPQRPVVKRPAHERECSVLVASMYRLLNYEYYLHGAEFNGRNRNTAPSVWGTGILYSVESLKYAQI
jgi:hypothetical protein